MKQRMYHIPGDTAHLWGAHIGTALCGHCGSTPVPPRQGALSSPETNGEGMSVIVTQDIRAILQKRRKIKSCD